MVGAVRGSTVQVAIVDEPELQRQSAAGWDMSEGNLMLLGVAGSGTSTTLASIALTLAKDADPAELDLMVLDMGSRELEALERLPHTVAYVGTGAGAKEQQARFLRHLHTELESRRAEPAGTAAPWCCWTAWPRCGTSSRISKGSSCWRCCIGRTRTARRWDCPFAVSTTRAKAVPSAMNEVTLQKWLFRLADDYDYSSLGVRGKEIPARASWALRGSPHLAPDACGHARYRGRGCGGSRAAKLGTRTREDPGDPAPALQRHHAGARGGTPAGGRTLAHPGRNKGG